MKQLLSLLILTSALGGQLLTAQDTTSCGVRWGQTVLTSPHRETDLPVMVSQGDTVHLFFVIYNSHFRLAYRRSCNNGLDWEPIRDIITDTARFRFPIPRIFPATDGSRIYVFFVGDSTGDTPVYITYSDNRGNDWSEPKTINSNISFIRSVAVLGDSLAVSGSVDNHPYDRTLYSTDKGITWGYGAAINGNDQRITITHGWLHMVYSYGDIIYKRSSDLGATWIDSVNLSMETSVAAVEPEIAAQPNGSIYVVWRDCKYGCVNGFSGSVVFRKSTDNGASWDADMALTETPWGSGSKISVRDSVLNVTWNAERVDFTIFHVENRTSFDGGSTWCPLIDLTPADSQSLDASNTVSNKSVVASWSTLNNTDTSFGIFLSYACAGEFSPMSVPWVLHLHPALIYLEQNYPNPFNPTTTIHYALPVDASVVLKIYNVFGQEVAALVNKTETAGYKQVEFNAANLSSGIYFYRLTAYGKDKSFVQTRKMMLMK